MVDTEALIDEWLNIAKRTDAMTDDDRRICTEMLQEIGNILDINFKVKFVANSKIARKINDRTTHFCRMINYINNMNVDVDSEYNMIDSDILEDISVFRKKNEKIQIIDPVKKALFTHIPYTEIMRYHRRLVENLERIGNIFLNIGCPYIVHGISKGFLADLESDSTPMEKCLSKLQRHCGQYVFNNSFCIIVDRPSIMSFDDQLRFHNDTGPAFAERDELGGNTSKWYRIHGVDVPSKIVMMPDQITIDEIRAQQNVEIRRHMMEKFGYERLLHETKAKLISEEHGIGKLYQTRFGSEKLTIVEVVNSTPEPDGSCRRYWLRVPPRMKTARQAVAWTFGKTEAEYQPEVET